MRPNLITQRDTAQAAAQASDDRVHVSLHRLLLLRHQAAGYSFLPRQPVHSILAGRHASRLRGRGLNFEEIRGYLPGDDVRTMDWKVTARTRKPHVRVYTEERDRPLLLLVDQRSHMFFGSTERMKSVVAAELAALGAWRALEGGDRVGAILFGDEKTTSLRPRAGKTPVMHLLNQVVRYNHQLGAGTAAPGAPSQLNTALEQATRVAGHDALVVIISDFEGADETTSKLTMQLAVHNDVLGILVVDPMRQHPPKHGRGVITNGTEQVEVDFGARKFARAIADDYAAQHDRMTAFLRKLSAPLLTVSTVGEPAQQIRKLLGGHP